MQTRRQILKLSIRFFLWIWAALSFSFTGLSTAFAALKKRILSKDTDPQSLINLNPAHLDTRELPVMPLEAFDTMGDKDAPYNPEKWRLEVTGAVRNPIKLTYADLLNMPAVEREVLLLCPGVFVNHGRWQGVSSKALLDRVKPEDSVSKVEFTGYSKFDERSEQYDFQEFKSGQVFLVHSVNGQKLPRKHGFPLRVVAEGHWGMKWTKYVYRVEFK